MNYLEIHTEKLKKAIIAHGLMHLASVLESDIKLTKEYREFLDKVVFEMKPIEIMLEVSNIPSEEDLCRAEMILEEPIEGGEYLAVD
jgi:hypothetical protein